MKKQQVLKFLIDHNVPRSVGTFLEKYYDVKLIGIVGPEMSDIQVIKLAINESRIIVTNDKDFIGLAMKHKVINVIIFSYISQKADIRIRGLKTVLPSITLPFNVIIMQ